MARDQDRDLRALRTALRRLAAEDLDGVLEEARAGARVEARRILEDHLVEELLREAAARSPDSPGAGHPAPSPPAPEGHGWWVYCVLAAEDGARVPSDLTGVEGSSVDVVREGGLAALVSRVPISDYGDQRLREHLEDIAWVERTARAHERVLEAALQTATIVPLRLCTIYFDQDGVRRLLREEQAALRQQLEALDGRAEWGLKVFVDRDRLSATAAGDRAESARAGSSEGADYLAGKQRERSRRNETDRLATACAQESHARLEREASAARVNPLQRPEAHGRDAEMLLNAVYLVQRENVGRLESAVEELREEYGPLGFSLELTGPWPAYNFVGASTSVAT